MKGANQMKKQFISTLVLLLLVCMVTASASAIPQTETSSETTNGLLLIMTLPDYVESYNKALVGTVPPSKNLLNEPDQTYIDAAETLLLDVIANPVAATIHDAAIYEMDPYGRFCVWFDVTESAAFGTFTRGSYYVFAKGLDSDGMITFLDGQSVLQGDDPEQIKAYRTASEFGVNPAEKAVQTYIQAADRYIDTAVIRLSPDEVYSSRLYTGRGYTVAATTEAVSGQIAGIQLTIGEEQLRSFPMAERNAFLNQCLSSTLAAVNGSTDTQDASAVINKLFDTSRLSPSGETVYEDGLLYGCTVENGTISFIVMPVDEPVYTAHTFWWVHQADAYLIAQGDSTLKAQEYDNAIWYYEEVGFTASTSSDLARAYYEKAAEYLAAERYDQAITFFTKAGTFSDTAVRLAETYYKKGDALYAAGEMVDAMNCFALAGNYEDANQRFLSCCYWLGDEALVAKDFDKAVTYFEQATGYLDAEMKVKQAHYERAEQLSQAGDEAGAVVYYELAQGYMDADDKAGADFYTKGEKALANEDYEAAIAFFTQAGNYKDSKEKLQEIADIETHKEYEEALELYNQYFGGVLVDYGAYDERPYFEAVTALAALDGYGDSADLLAKLDETHRILTFYKVCGKELFITGIGNILKETSDSTGEIILESVGSSNDTLVFKAMVDRSSYSASFSRSYNINPDSSKYNHYPEFLCIMMTGYVEGNGLKGTYIPSDWTKVAKDKYTMTCFVDGYKIEIEINDGTITIDATQNTY